MIDVIVNGKIETPYAHVQPELYINSIHNTHTSMNEAYEKKQI